ncbi:MULTISPECIES: archaeal proteasome endopeptidase complex subunit beta [Thermofilum]|jgi:proteasome beta subunit|uniref:Proteasome subunit beta n=2 Tax=Thermofilum adornatum TaxID=1365176 RepID=S5ZV58_9CREN|nr:MULTISPECIES: archaeal proteasome endopeptidase complex subunit beta [Thermofilum]AGT34974.1 proteasome subunit beta [Thermofilum adornatum]AJB42703.1 Proteasome subunit beta, archaeal [Thermofilum adornatum 1505]MCC5998604.1 archaeal proteasome endopeptidase complex subunit beta [Thermofilum sp.]MCI4409419.1 archaeal proteasome endopeptidase complex subunit beta [Thermofilum sp.]NAZ24957.1 archaeal proteasome endopeptidase complex subunit beta [Thermofilum sp.]
MEALPGTTVGIKVDGGVVLAAEKRVAYQLYLMSKSGKKVYLILDKMGLASAGLMADMQTLARIIEAEMRLYELDSGISPKVQTVAKTLSYILYERRLFPYYAEILVGGIDEEGSHLYTLDPIGAIIEDNYSALGSGTQLAISIIEAEYKPDMKVEDAKTLAIKALYAAMKRDASSGDGVDVLVISKDKTYEQTYSVGDIEKMFSK